MWIWPMVLILIEALGMGLTLLGLSLLFLGARRRYREVLEQFDRALELGREEEEEVARRPGDGKAIAERFARLHLENGLPRPAGFGESHQAGYESVNIMYALGNGALRDLIIASAGVVLSGAAGILSTVFPVS